MVKNKDPMIKHEQSSESEYYDVAHIDKYNAHYNVIFGKRSIKLANLVVV